MKNLKRSFTMSLKSYRRYIIYHTLYMNGKPKIQLYWNVRTLLSSKLLSFPFPWLKFHLFIMKKKDERWNSGSVSAPVKLLSWPFGLNTTHTVKIFDLIFVHTRLPITVTDYTTGLHFHLLWLSLAWEHLTARFISENVFRPFSFTKNH